MTFGFGRNDLPPNRNSVVRGEAIAGGALRSVFGRGLGYLSQYAFIAACTRSLGGEAAGTVLSLLAFVNILSVIGRFGADTCGLRAVSISYAARNHARSRSEAAAVLCIAMIGSSLLLLCAWLSRDYYLPVLGISPESGEERLLYLIPLLTLTGVLGELLRAIRKMLASAITQLVSIYLLPALLLAPVAIGGSPNPELVFFGLASGATVALVYGGAIFMRDTVPSQKDGGATPRKGLFFGAMYFMVMSVVTMFIANIDILMVSRYLGQSDVAIYVAGSKTALAVSLGLVGIGAITAHSYAAAFAAHDQARLTELVDSAARWCMFQAVIVAAVLVVLARPILSIFGEGFEQNSAVLSVLIISQVVNASFGPLAVILSMTRQERRGATILLFTAFAAVFLYIALIPRWGLVGAAIANLSVVVIWNSAMAWVAWKKLDSMVPYPRIAVGVLIICVIWMFSRFIDGGVYLSILMAVIAAMATAAFSWICLLRHSDRRLAIDLVRTRLAF